MCSAFIQADSSAFFSISCARSVVSQRLRRVVLATILFFLGFAGTRAKAAEPADEVSAGRGFSLTVVVEGVRNSKGTIGMLVFNSPNGWPDELRLAFRGQSVQAVAGKTVLRLSGLPEGDYGVLVIHDENGNNKLDRDWVGKPIEQWGMSNNPRVLLSAPTFQQAHFHLNTDKEIHIILK